LYGLGKPGRWRELDLLLLETLQQYEAGLCKGCGQPLIHSTEQANTDAYTVESMTCIVCEYMESNREEEPEKGAKPYVVNHMSDDHPGGDPYG